MEGTEVSAPNYPPFGSVKWYVDFFKLLERIKIDQVDVRFLKANKIAPGNEHKVVSGLKFLNLVDKDGNATERMKSLGVIGDKLTENFERMVRDAYSVLFSKVVDIEKAIPDDIINSLRLDYHMALSTARQGARIFVFLAQKAKMPISKSLAGMRTPELEVSKKRAKGRKKKAKSEASKVDLEMPPVPEGMHESKWTNDILMYLRKGTRKTRERIARTAKKLIDMYVEEEEPETK
jgi:hypothetical protein